MDCLLSSPWKETYDNLFDFIRNRRGTLTCHQACICLHLGLLALGCSVYSACVLYSKLQTLGIKHQQQTRRDFTPNTYNPIQPLRHRHSIQHAGPHARTRIKGGNTNLRCHSAGRRGQKLRRKAGPRNVPRTERRNFGDSLARDAATGVTFSSFPHRPASCCAPTRIPNMAAAAQSTLGMGEENCITISPATSNKDVKFLGQFDHVFKAWTLHAAFEQHPAFTAVFERKREPRMSRMIQSRRWGAFVIFSGFSCCSYCDQSLGSHNLSNFRPGRPTYTPNNQSSSVGRYLLPLPVPIPC